MLLESYICLCSSSICFLKYIYMTVLLIYMFYLHIHIELKTYTFYLPRFSVLFAHTHSIKNIYILSPQVLFSLVLEGLNEVLRNQILLECDRRSCFQDHTAPLLLVETDGNYFFNFLLPVFLFFL